MCIKRVYYLPLMVFLSLNLSNTVILNINGIDYCCIINRISKHDAVNLLQDSDLNGKSETL